MTVRELSEFRRVDKLGLLHSEFSAKSMVGHPVWQLLGVGGLSLVVFALMVLFGFDQPTNQIAQIGFVLAALLNYPHFAASLGIMYSDHRTRLFGSFRYLMAGVIVPVSLVTTLIWACIDDKSFGALVIGTLGAYLVYWHYTKQFYGVVIHYLRRSGVELTRMECNILKYSLLSIWYYIVVLLLDHHSSSWFFELPRFSIEHVPDIVVRGFMWLASVLFGAGATVLVSALIRTSFAAPVWISIVAYVSAFVWLFPAIQRPFFIQLIPAFHSLQYLVLVGGLKLKETTLRGEAPGRILPLFAIAVTAGGMLLFKGAPWFFGSILNVSGTEYNPMALLAGIYTVISLHHYFVDSVIWRRGGAF